MSDIAKRDMRAAPGQAYDIATIYTLKLQGIQIWYAESCTLRSMGLLFLASEWDIVGRLLLIQVAYGLILSYSGLYITGLDFR